MTSPDAIRVHALICNLLDLEDVRSREERIAAAGLSSSEEAALRSVLLEPEADGFLAKPVMESLDLDEISLSQAPLLVPELLFDGYRLVRFLGEGGMGVVWLAEHVDSGSMVAMKFLAHAWISPVRRERFRREFRVLSRLKHRNIASLRDSGVMSDGTPWFAMEFVEGRRLEVAALQIDSLDALLELFLGICAAVQYVHSRGILHRDLKASNVLVEADGTPKLLDFGIARDLDPVKAAIHATLPGLHFVSPRYSAPEVWDHSDATVGSDVFSLGVMLAEMLVGEAAFRCGSHSDRDAAMRMSTELRPSRALLSSAEANPGLRFRERGGTRQWDDLDVLCETATSSEAQRRYGSVETLIADVRRFLANEPLAAQRPSMRYRLRKFVDRHRRGVAAAALLALTVSPLGAAAEWRIASARREAVRQAERTQRIQDFMLSLFATKGKEEVAPGSVTVESVVDRGVNESQRLHDDPALTAQLNQTLGEMYIAIGRPAKAEKLLSESMTAMDRMLPEFLSRDVTVRRELISVYMNTSDPARAEGLMSDTLAFMSSHDVRNPLELARMHHQLGSLKSTRGDYPAAASEFQFAIQLQQANGAPTKEIFETMQALGGVEIYRGQYREADRLHTQLLEIARKLFGPTSIQAADVLQDLGESAEVQGRYQQAEQYEREAVALAEAWYGQHDLHVANKATALASTLIDERRFDEASMLLERALEDEEKVVAPTSLYVSKTLKSIGLLQLSRGQPRLALATFDQVLAIYHLHQNAPSYLSARIFIYKGLAMTQIGDLRAAEAQERKALELLLTLRGGEDQYTNQARMELGHVLAAEHKDAEAIRVLTAAETHLSRLGLANSWAMGTVRADLGMVKARLATIRQP